MQVTAEVDYQVPSTAGSREGANRRRSSESRRASAVTLTWPATSFPVAGRAIGPTRCVAVRFHSVGNAPTQWKRSP
jgi:hypothetical protein